MDNVNYKSVFRVLKSKYPTIAKELMPEPQLNDYSQITQIFKKFARQVKYSEKDIRKNKDESLLLFVAVIIQAYDPACFVDQNKKLKNGLRAAITQNLECDKTWISHLLRIVRSYMRIHKTFAGQVTYLYDKVIGADENTSNRHKKD